MPTTINSNGNFYLQLGDEQPGLAYTEAGDLILNNPKRSSVGRALVTYHKGELVMNYKNDFKGGVRIHGLKKLMDLPNAPEGVNTFDIVIDAEGNVYKKD